MENENKNRKKGIREGLIRIFRELLYDKKLPFAFILFIFFFIWWRSFLVIPPCIDAKPANQRYFSRR